jgi:hypothetical protein
VGGSTSPELAAERYSVLISGTDGKGTNPSDFTAVHTEILNPAQYTETLTWRGMPYGLKTVHIPLAAYIGETIHVAFRHWGTFDQDVLMLTDIKVWEFTGYVDAEVSEILSPKSGVLTNNEEVTVRLRNNGGADITNFSVTVNVNGTVNITETPTDAAIPSLSFLDYTFNQTINLADVNRSHTVTVTVNAEGDQNPNNDSKSVTIANFPSGKVDLGGYRVFDESWTPENSPRSIVKFTSANPGAITSVYPYAGNNSIAAGDIVNNILHFYTLDINTGNPRDFIKLDADDFILISRTQGMTAYAEDMAFDPTTNTLFGIRDIDDQSTLVTINFENGNMTTVGNMGRFMYTLAVNAAGQMYGVDAAGNFCSINKTTGATTIIGNTGQTPLWMQSMAFDHHTGRLFWAMCNTNDEGRLLEIHLPSGVTYDHGMLGNNAEITMLYITGSNGTSIGNRFENDEKNPLKAWLENDRLYIAGLNIGEQWSVYTVTGKLVYQAVANSDIMSVIPPIRGIYIIRSGSRTVKVVY